MRFSMMTRQSSVKSTLLSFHDKTTVVYSIDLCRGHKVIAHYQVWYLKENRFSAFSDFPLNENKKKNQKPPQNKQIPNKQTKIATKTSKPTQFICKTSNSTTRFSEMPHLQSNHFSWSHFYHLQQILAFYFPEDDSEIFNNISANQV